MKKVIVSVVAALVLAGGLFSINASASFNHGMCDSIADEYPGKYENCDYAPGEKCCYDYTHEDGHVSHVGVPDSRNK